VKVAVVGLGTAGSAAAAALARRGITVVGLEAGPLSEAGARWVNGVPRWTFAAGGFAEPAGEELREPEGGTLLVAGSAAARLPSGLEVDMRFLVARLQRLAREAGAELRGDLGPVEWAGGELQVGGERVAADVVVDAAGLLGPNLLGAPAFSREDLCAAAQEVRRVADPAGAEAFLARWGAGEGEGVCFTGVAGGYSIVHVRVARGEVGILTGSIPALGHPGGKALLDRFVGDHPWVGPLAFGGARAIPVRRAWEVVGHGAVAAIGDRAGQVYPGHGSGIGMQLAAAELLARALAEGRGCWGYNVDWQRTYGGRLAASDLFRRFSSTLGPDEVARLIDSGLLGGDLARDAMAQRSTRPSIAVLTRAARALARLPGLRRRLGALVTRMGAAEVWWARYPAAPARWPAWARVAGAITGRPAWGPPEVVAGPRGV
jgi:flavin-dependent dehydrogenase